MKATSPLQRTVKAFTISLFGIASAFASAAAPQHPWGAMARQDADFVTDWIRRESITAIYPARDAFAAQLAAARRVGIEDLNVKGMLGNRQLARAIADMGFGELRRQLEYKAAWRGAQVIVMDRWYPSSKTCSCCGYRLTALALGARAWTCPGCDAQHDRDVNAAINLRNMAVSSTVAACGGEGAGPALNAQGETGSDEAGIQHKVNYA